MKEANGCRVVHTMGRNNCGGRCIIHAHVRDGKIEQLTTDTLEAAGDCVPLTACVRGMNYHKTVLGEDRLRYPMKRVGRRGEGKFERITWEEATDTIAREWVRIRDTYGVGSRYVNYATGISAMISGSGLAKRLLKLDGGYLDYYNSYSTACITQSTNLMYGTAETGNDLADWLNSKLSQLVTAKALAFKELLQTQDVDILLTLLQKRLQLLADSDTEQSRLDGALKELLLQALSMQHDTVYDLVLAKLHSYDRDVLIAKMEQRVGDDLQNIRKSGTCIGGLMGAVLFIIATMGERLVG